MDYIPHNAMHQEDGRPEALTRKHLKIIVCKNIWYDGAGRVVFAQKVFIWFYSPLLIMYLPLLSAERY